MSGGWDALAPTYDLQLPLERAAVEYLIDLLAPQPSDRLLDLGTGTGAVLARSRRGRADRPRSRESTRPRPCSPACRRCPRAGR